MTPAETSEAKRCLRSRLRVSAPTPADPADASARLRESLLGWLDERPEFATIAMFACLPGEPDLLPLLEIRPHRHWCLPRVASAAISFHAVRSADELVPGCYGIREPTTNLPPVLPEQIDLFLCPGLAFDPAGHRLGHGAGFYDRFLIAARPATVRVGIAFACRVLTHVPHDLHDIPMDWLVTELGITPAAASGNEGSRPPSFRHNGKIC
jgi:5-formyltetrahydrofolate cyclo-ligase